MADKASARYVHRMQHGENASFDASRASDFRKLNIYDVRAKGAKDEFSVSEQVSPIHYLGKGYLHLIILLEKGYDHR